MHLVENDIWVHLALPTRVSPSLRIGFATLGIYAISLGKQIKSNYVGYLHIVDRDDQNATSAPYT
jgi:hypothetical protein